MTANHRPDQLPPSVKGSNLPDKKVVAAAVVTVVTFIFVQAGVVAEVPTGVEGAAAVIVAYLWPNV